MTTTLRNVGLSNVGLSNVAFIRCTFSFIACSLSIVCFFNDYFAQYFKFLAIFIALYHAAEMLIVPMDAAHRYHHYAVILTEVCAVILFSTPFDYKLGCLASVPLGSNIFSELKTYDKKYTTLYYMNYIFLKMFSIFTNYTLFLTRYSESSQYGRYNIVTLALIHSVQLYFCSLIALRLQNSLLVTSLFCAMLASIAAVQY